MASEWTTMRVRQIASNTRNALVGGPFGSNLVTRDYVEHGIPVIRGQNMIGRWVSGDFVFVTKEKAESLEANLAHPSDIVFTQRGTLGQVSLIPKNPFEVYLVSQSQMKLTVDREIADPLFFYYQFLSPVQQEHIKQHTIQGGVPHTNLGILRDTTVIVPPINEQHAIAHILGTLDDKIELNRKMNETLEAIARTIFKSWFVDFDPVRAKASGEPPDSICRRLGLTPDLLALFPNRLVDSELSEIPVGWMVSRVGEEFDLTMGQSPPGETYNEISEGIPFYQGRTDFESRYPKRRIYCTAPTRFAKKGDTLISVRAPVGDINMAGEDCAIGRGVAAARHKSGCGSYTYQFMYNLREVFARFEAGGTVFGSINKKDFNGIPCLAPRPDVIGAFSLILKPLDGRIESNILESDTLSQLRDTLLPRLISGKLQIPVEDVA